MNLTSFYKKYYFTFLKIKYFLFSFDFVNYILCYFHKCKLLGNIIGRYNNKTNKKV